MLDDGVVDREFVEANCVPSITTAFDCNGPLRRVLRLTSSYRLNLNGRQLGYTLLNTQTQILMVPERSVRKMKYKVAIQKKFSMRITVVDTSGKHKIA